jgi:hypothetical protein
MERYAVRIEGRRDEQLSRGLPLIKWLLLPHVVILFGLWLAFTVLTLVAYLSVLFGALTGAATYPMNGNSADSTPLGIFSVGVLIVVLSLLFAGRYPRGLYDLLVAIARWSLRVTAYLALLTSDYPPFRLDQGDTEPEPLPSSPPIRTPIPAAPVHI